MVILMSIYLRVFFFFLCVVLYIFAVYNVLIMSEIYFFATAAESGQLPRLATVAKLLCVVLFALVVAAVLPVFCGQGAIWMRSTFCGHMFC